MRTLITVATFIMMFACTQNNNQQKGNSTNSENNALRQEVLNIGKMHCEMCVASIEKGLESVEGVEYVKVKLEDSTAIVQFDDAKTNLAELKKTIEQRGYILKNSNLE